MLTHTEYTPKSLRSPTEHYIYSWYAYIQHTIGSITLSILRTETRYNGVKLEKEPRFHFYFALYDGYL
ncbi:hypothetical protein BDV26DRAFT_252610 [Aspergillus bertholletiae]|uniref:Uncharacterized protein n=1 Tax=Aspergillus bertholletiae TaxID=1226010 RepID=A0A5N7BLW4_9EURO|nr:hypothetical protein BDV26DRAFT_252610 [Aspergillus bertholletiae]